MESVVLIASGYDWTCSLCDTEYNEFEVVDSVECKKCGEKFNAVVLHGTG